VRKEYVIDTNVPVTANLATQGDADIPADCISACVQYIKHITQNGGLVLDDGGEIFEEYRRRLSLRGQPGQGDAFVKWVCDHQWDERKVTRVRINRQGDSYQEFPTHPELTSFDPSDRKFVAVSNARPDKPAILQGLDSKWWGWASALEEGGIEVCFLCPEIVEATFKKKMTK
jgi:hypothetical protein